MVDEPNDKLELPSDEELAARFEQVRAKLDAQLPGPGDELQLDLQAEAMTSKVAQIASKTPQPESLEELDAKLSDIQARAQTARQSHQRSIGLDPKEIESSARKARGSGLGLMGAYMILGFPMVFAAIGYFVDRARGGGTTWTGILTTIGAALGVFVTVAMLQKHAKDI